MNTIRKAIFIIAAGMLAGGASAQVVKTNSISTGNVDVHIAGNYLNVSVDFKFDSISPKLQSNHQYFITPVVTRDSMSANLPSVLVSGRKMHISYLRGVLKNFKDIKKYDINTEMQRKNGKTQTLDYTARIPIEPWMKSKDARITFVYDSCGCGTKFGRHIGDPIKIHRKPELVATMITPPVEPLPEEIHEGRARVQFEVDRTKLHLVPYRCKSGQLIDNREQLQMIYDSVTYALDDPKVELSMIEICGYASPESPYRHNDDLATGRSKALAEHLAEHYSLPKGSVKYSAVPENWGEFREEVEVSNEISERERRLLLELIDAPATTPEEYDRKETILKTDSRYSKLYRTKILPQWFPRLRATTFAIHTRLKPMEDEELAKVIETNPEKMSLNQMFRVARLYPEGSDKFNNVIDIALKYYPKNEIAITNAATAAIQKGDYARAKELLTKIGNTPEVYNLLGIIAAEEEAYDAAASYFEKAGDLPTAVRNLEQLK